MVLVTGFLTKDPQRRLGAFGNAYAIKTHAFFKSINWEALLEKQVKPPFKPHNMDVSSTDSVFISCHKQLSVQLHVSEGSSSEIRCHISVYFK